MSLEHEMKRYFRLMQTLPPLVSVVVWDVINDRFDELTIQLALAASKEEFERYDLIRCVVAADLKHPPLDLARCSVLHRCGGETHSGNQIPASCCRKAWPRRPGNAEVPERQRRRRPNLAQLPCEPNASAWLGSKGRP